MKNQIVTVTCDIDGREPAKELRFAYSGRAYRIDLCEECKASFAVFVNRGNLVRDPIKDRRIKEKA